MKNAVQALENVPNGHNLQTITLKYDLGDENEH
jgi:hypothetical protein